VSEFSRYDGRRNWSPGSTYNRVTGRWTVSAIETYWTCPEHDFDANNRCDDCGNDEVECLDCLFGDQRILYDEDGWATLTVSWRWLEPGLGA
jgi:hypothetical protein